MRFIEKFKKVFRSYSGVERVLSIILIVLFVLTGAKYLLDKTGIFGPGVSAIKEGIYTEGFQSNILRINPVYADMNEPDRDVSKLVFSGLTKYDTETQKIIGDMADVTISEDKLTYTFVLKDGIMWHDGEPVTADDVYFTFHDVIQNPDFQNSVLKVNFEGVTINKIDSRTVSFVLTKPNSFFITNTTTGLLPVHLLQNIAVPDLINYQFNQNPIGTGPYKISSPLTNMSGGVSQIVLEKFDQFYGPQPKILKIRFFGFPSKTELLANLNSLNAVPKLSDEAVEAVINNGRFSMYGYSLPQYQAVFFNMDNPLLKSTKVRQAMRKAIFKDVYLDQLPNTIRVETPVLSLDQTAWTYAASMDEATKLLDDAGFNQFYEEQTTESETSDSSVAEETAAAETTPTETAPAETEITAATAATTAAEPALDATAASEAEETVSAEPALPKYRQNAGGTKLEFRLITRLYPEGSYKYNELKIILDYLQINWQRAGIKLNIEMYDTATLQAKIQARDYDLLLYGQSLGYNFDLYGYFHSTQASETGLNLSNYQSFNVDVLIEGIRDTFIDEAKTKKLEELAKAIHDDIPAIFLYRPVYYYASDNKVEGIKLDHLAFPADRFCHIDEWSFT
jgi:peptide/nickel transport system substrate-binding protein